MLMTPSGPDPWYLTVFPLILLTYALVLMCYVFFLEGED